MKQILHTIKLNCLFRVLVSSNPTTRQHTPTMLQDIEDMHKQACSEGKHTYIDPTTNLTVFTRVSHLARGSCCGCGCRHCPFQKTKISEDEDSQRTREVTTKKRQRPQKPVISTLSPTSTSTSTFSSSSSSSSSSPPITVSKNKVYTKTGDSGTSSLFTGERASKDDLVFEALGTIDELNSFVGFARDRIYAECSNHPLVPFLERTMKVLLSLGSSVATPVSGATPRQLERATFDKQNVHVVEVEHWIDQLTDALPDLRTFVLPYGGASCSSLHICRSICRRCERCVISVKKLRDYNQRIDSGLKFLNRLSDFFFVAARYACHFSKHLDTAYRADELDVVCESFPVKVLTNGDNNSSDDDDSVISKKKKSSPVVLLSTAVISSVVVLVVAISVSVFKSKRR